ncbi:hypothetical protein [Jiangella sp. DSM 45060]|uniref:hypothetical protein n=1 Tax=Jiangella sp. DSM 45060 TaxID=1798224 RepID=UPI00087DB705|nr:hypothetical protein [Jiangella sp. DSM 45060]SDS96154.1 hypothetical protein SAMN04515669_2392 [Jiangella sp. DSM 45060]
MHDDFAEWYRALWPRVLRVVTIAVGHHPGGSPDTTLDIAESVAPISADDERLTASWHGDGAPER